MIKKNLGKNTLGEGKKMSVSMKTYDRSTHDLSFACRTTMGVGTLVPVAKILGLPGDTYDIDIDTRLFTNPTIGPLFGQYKLQIDVFTCPIRLYIAQLHNNALNIAMNMNNVKLPQYEVAVNPINNPTKDNKFPAINPSSVLAYLGIRGYSYRATEQNERKNITPLLCYWDIVGQYYVNKQEKKFYSITTTGEDYSFIQRLVFDQGCLAVGTMIKIEMPENIYNTGDFIVKLSNGNLIKGADLKKGMYSTWASDSKRAEFTIAKGTLYCGIKEGAEIIGVKKGSTWEDVELKAWDLEVLNDIREDLLKQGKAQKIYTISTGTTPKNPIEDIISMNAEKKFTSRGVQSGLAIKTYQSDIFTSFLDKERVEKITNGTKVSTASGGFTIDALNLSQKRYNLENRIAATSGTYKDYIEVAYTAKYGMRTETPIYEGGMSDTIVFQEVVNTANSENNPLGQMGARGVLAGAKKGGKLHINVDEPSYIIAIASITPYIDYSEGNDWDMNLDNIGQLHLPEFDGIGFEDLKVRQVAYWADDLSAFGKTTAWQNYMTNFNKVYGDFAIEGNMAHMCLNRYFSTGEYNNNQANTSTYINPSLYNYTFAITTLGAMNFQLQVGFGIKARRKMSARQLPRM